jgi:actin-related protein
VIIELGARYMRAGFAGDATPKAVINFGPEEQRRPGDYRRWEVGYEKSWRERTRGREWGKAHELWRPDLRSLDLGLIGDKIDRAIREAFTKSVGG